MPDDKNKLHNAIKYISKSTYGVYVSTDSLYIDDFYKFPNKDGLVIVVYGNGISTEQQNEFLVICIDRVNHQISVCNTQGKFLDYQSYEVLNVLIYKNKPFDFIQYRSKCKDKGLLMNRAYMFYLVKMMTNGAAILNVPSDQKLLDMYYTLFSNYTDSTP